MSKNNGPVPSGTVGYESGYLIHIYHLQVLEGRLLTFIESWSLPTNQEKAVKDLVRQEVWKVLEPCFVVAGEDVTALHEKYDKENKGENVSRVVGNSRNSTR